VGLDFAERLVAGGGRVAVPTTLNVSSLDLLHPELYRGDPETARQARRLMDAYVALGCAPTWTCAPYQLPGRPAFGEQIAWAESNAIVFANSVLGARTDRYGDFMDIAAALTGRAPDAGLHRTENRRARVLFRLRGVPERLLGEDVLYPVLGHLVGAEAGTAVPVLDGLPASATEDQLKALGAGAASSGAVALFHAVGVTPEAPTLDAALHGRAPERVVEVTPAALRAARDSLTTAAGGRLSARARGGGVLRLHGAARRARGGGAGVAPGARPGRRAARGGHLHVRHAHPAPAGRPRDDQLRQVGLLRAGEHRRGGGLRQPGGVRALGRRRRGVAR
jgi:predicted aconitase